MDGHPIACCPYLPLQEEVRVGPWRLVPHQAYDGEWVSDTFHTRANQLLGKMHDTHSVPLNNITLIAHADEAIGKTVPEHQGLRALQSALDLAMIIPSVTHYQVGTPIPTSDNSRIQRWYIAHDGRIVIQTGGKQQIDNLDSLDRDDLIISCPLEVPQPDRLRSVTLDKSIANAVYRLASESSPDKDFQRRVEQLLTATHWWAKSWQNSLAIDQFNRVVLLKIALEALFGNSKISELLKSMHATINSFESGYCLECLDEWNALRYLMVAPVGDKNREYSLKSGQLKRVNDFEHWIRSFNDVRNTIIHEGRRDMDLDYNEPVSPFNGSYMSTADRVLRDLILMQLNALGYRYLWLPLLDRIAMEFAAKDAEQCKPSSEIS